MGVTGSIHRNKEHMTLDLKTEKGKDIFFALTKKADVILEGFRPGVVKRLGVDYETVRGINPGIIYCAITGYGQKSPFKDRAGHDISYLSQSGMLSMMLSDDGRPCMPGVQIADIVGGINAALGITMALFTREKSGTGQYIDISMTDGALAMLPIAAGMLWGQARLPQRARAISEKRYACYNIYETRDGKHVTLGALEPQFWEAVCRHFKVPEYIPMQFNEEKKDDILDDFKIKFKQKTRDEWMTIFEGIDICLDGVLSVEEALNSDYAKSRNMVVSTEIADNTKTSLLGIPVKLSDSPGAIRTPPPEFGQDTCRILKELNYNQKEIETLEKDGVI